MFTPKWKKEAHHLYKDAKKFIHYKRDLLDEEKIDLIESMRSELRKNLKSGDRDEIDKISKKLRDSCENALPHSKPLSLIAENIEVLFVAIVIALGIRAYYIQPFRIPTGSMRPTLNGIIGHVESKEKWPALPIRLLQKATHGRSYISVINEIEGDRIIRIEQRQQYHFFTRTVIHYSSGRTQNISGSLTAFFEIINLKELQKLSGFPLSANPQTLLYQLPEIKLPAGFVIAEGHIDTGDLVLVDKFSYHFRNPEPGEVFVFNTIGIKQIQAEENPGSHYIKRLIATPGQKVELRGTPSKYQIQKPNGDNGILNVIDHALVYVDGKKMTAPGVLKVEARKGVYKDFKGYQAIGRLAPGRYVKLADKPSTGKSEYWAQGDNSYNSSDSRNWGTVKEFNLIGPAMVVLWPFGSGHWGKIK